jgi:hypothetical protein
LKVLDDLCAICADPNDRKEWNHRVTTRGLFRGIRRADQSPICPIDGCERLTSNDRVQFIVRQHVHLNVAMLDCLRGLPVQPVCDFSDGLEIAFQCSLQEFSSDGAQLVVDRCQPVLSTRILFSLPTVGGPTVQTLDAFIDR